jgi:hypothetical protein
MVPASNFCRYRTKLTNLKLQVRMLKTLYSGKSFFKTVLNPSLESKRQENSDTTDIWFAK